MPNSVVIFTCMPQTRYHYLVFCSPFPITGPSGLSRARNWSNCANAAVLQRPGSRPTKCSRKSSCVHRVSSDPSARLASIHIRFAFSLHQHPGALKCTKPSRLAGPRRLRMTGPGSHFLFAPFLSLPVQQIQELQVLGPARG